MPTFSYSAYDDDQITWPGGSPSPGDTITFTFPSDHLVSITDDDANLVDGTDDRDDEDANQTAIVYDEFGAIETSGQVQPRDEIALTDGTNTFFVTEVFIASSNSTYYIFQDPAPALNTTYTVTSVTNPNSTSYTSFSTTGVTCFCRGTLIRTPEGDRAVETLRRGDLVCTLDNGDQPILWRGDRFVTAQQMRSNYRLRPWLVQAGALRPGEPARPTFLSRQHRVLLKSTGDGSRQEEVLVPIHTLSCLDGVSMFSPPAAVHYIHLLTRDHNLVWSNGFLSETLLLTSYSVEVTEYSDAGTIANFGTMTPARPILPNKLARRLALRRVGLQMA